MNKIQFRSNLIDPSTRFLAFQPRNNSRQGNKSKSNKKNNYNKNILTPCQPLGDKLLKAVIEKNQRKIVNNRREKTQQSMLQNSKSMDESRCFNHPQKKGQYFIESNPNKKFCLKCNLILNGGNNASFVTKQKLYKKQILDRFKQQLVQVRRQIQQNSQVIQSSIQLSQQHFSEHSNYINQSFSKIKDQIQQKRRQLINNLIIAQQNLKKQYQQNTKKINKITKALDRYEFDIKKFYEQVIEELPKTQFDKIMEEYNQKVNKNIKKKIASILIQDGICVYIPNIEINKIIQKASVEYYQPIIKNPDPKNDQHTNQYLQSNEDNLQRLASNSLDSKMNDLFLNLNRKSPNLKGFQKKRQVELELFQKKRHPFFPQNQKDIYGKDNYQQSNINSINNHKQIQTNNTNNSKQMVNKTVKQTNLKNQRQFNIQQINFKHNSCQNKQNINTNNFSQNNCQDYFSYKHENPAKFTFKV